MSDPVLDARGVAIEPGDTVIYGFGVGRSVAMAEGVVLAAEPCDGDCSTPTRHQTLSLTPTGMIRVRVVRRSYSSGEKPVVAINPDRVVVLKEASYDPWPFLPPSPLPTQDEKRLGELLGTIRRYKETLLQMAASGEIPQRWANSIREEPYTFNEVKDFYETALRETETELAQVVGRLR